MFAMKYDHTSSLLLTLLLLLTSATCSKVSDRAARKRQVRNLAGNAVKNYFLEQLQQTKVAIDTSYRALYRLQDSIHRASFDASTTANLYWGDLYASLDLWAATRFPLAAYTNGVTTGDLGGQMTALYGDPVPGKQAARLYYLASIRGPDGRLPADYAQFREMERVQQRLGLAFAAYAEKRKYQAAQAYLALAATWQEKAAEMDRLLKTDQRFSMTDAERLQLQKQVLDMVEKSYALVEESDRLSLAAHAKPSIFETNYLDRLRQRLTGQALAATLTIKN